MVFNFVVVSQTDSTANSTAEKIDSSTLNFFEVNHIDAVIKNAADKNFLAIYLRVGEGEHTSLIYGKHNIFINGEDIINVQSGKVLLNAIYK